LDDIPCTQECETSNAVHEEGLDNVHTAVPTIGMCFTSVDEAKTSTGSMLSEKASV